MPGELKNLVALAISSGSNKYHHHQHHQQQQQQEKKLAAAEARRGGGVEKKHGQTRRAKEDSTSGAKRFTKLLSKSVGAVSQTIANSHAHSLPPSTDAVTKKAPVASPESDGSSLLNGGSCASVNDYGAERENSPFYDPSPRVEHEIGDETPKLQSTRWRLKSEGGKPRSVVNGSSTANGKEGEECSADEAPEEHWRSVALARHRCSTDASRGAETDDETMLSSAPGVDTGVDGGKAPSTSALPTSSTGGTESGERARGWYSTRKSYRSVAYKTWTVGSARKLLNSSRSDYDLPPSSTGADAVRTGTAALGDGSVSDGEEKFYNCSYSRSQDDDLDRSIYLSTISGIQTADTSSTIPDKSSSLTVSDLNKIKARKCASSDAVTLFANVHLANEAVSFLSPVESVPSTSSDKTSTANQQLSNKPKSEIFSNISKNGGDDKNVDPISLAGDRDALRVSENDSRLNRNLIPDTISGTAGKNGAGKSWLLVASSSSDDVWREDGEEKHSRSIREETSSRNGKNNRMSNKSGSRSTGDCFSSEDYFKFTLKKRLMQQQQQNRIGVWDEMPNGAHDRWPTSISSPQPRIATPPLLALDRDIRAALHNFDDFDDKAIRSGSPPSRRDQTRSSSPTTLSSLMATAQQRWRQQSERFSRRMERASCRGKIENHRQPQLKNNFDSPLPLPPPPPLPPTRFDSRTPPPTMALIRIPTAQLSSSSFSSCSSSSSSSMSWISQKQQKQKSTNAFSPLAVSVLDANNGDHDDDWPPNDPSNAQRNLYTTPSMRSRSKTTTAATTAGANSPFRNSDEVVQFLKQELANIRKKDHQILTQLKMLDAEISRRKSETDALAPTRSSSESDEFESGEYTVDEPLENRFDKTSKAVVDINSRFGVRLSNGASTGPFTDAYSNSLHASVPPLPKFLDVNFKTL